MSSASWHVDWRLTLLAPWVLVLEFCEIVDVLVDYDVEVIFRLVGCNISRGECLRHDGGVDEERR